MGAAGEAAGEAGGEEACEAEDMTKEAAGVAGLLRKGGSAPKGGAHPTVCFACAASENLESCFFTDDLLIVWQCTQRGDPTCDWKLRRRGSAPKGGCSLCGLFRMRSQRVSGKLFLFKDNLLMAWQSTPKVAPRSRISRSAALFS